jgi:hypothetical protein
MAFIGESRRGTDRSWKDYVCLDLEDCEVLSQIIGSLIARKLRSYEYYKGILDLGEATEKQTDKLDKARDELNAAENIQRSVLEYIKREKKK